MTEARLRFAEQEEMAVGTGCFHSLDASSYAVLAAQPLAQPADQVAQFVHIGGGSGGFKRAAAVVADAWRRGAA